MKFSKKLTKKLKKLSPSISLIATKAANNNGVVQEVDDQSIMVVKYLNDE